MECRRAGIIVLRCLALVIALMLAACTPLNGNDSRTFDELFDQAIGKFCHEQPESVCRENGIELLADLEDRTGIEQEAMLRHMVDTIDPDSLTDPGIPRMAQAIMEAWRQLSFHLR